MTTPFFPSLAIGATTGLATLAAQSDVIVTTNSFVPMALGIASTVVSAIVSWTVLRLTVRVLQRDVHQMQQELQSMNEALVTTRENIARIEGRLG